MNKLAVVQFMPLEYYPPTMNFLRYIAGKSEYSTRVYSTKNIKKRKEFSANLKKIYRSALPNRSENVLLRLVKYWGFNLLTLIRLIFYKPQFILYYESYSAWPVYCYSKFFNQSIKIFIHNHEYFWPQWYENGMRLVKFYHNLEKRYLYPKATWISQTNNKRAELFLEDHSALVLQNKTFVLPNYPPMSWRHSINRSDLPKHNRIRLVYIGALSFEDTYIKECCEWVVKLHRSLLLDIYSFNLCDDVLEYFDSNRFENIRFFNHGLEYDEIPDKLNEYDVGLILYKANSINYKYNETNKLYEYLMCGLSVWYSDAMLLITEMLESFPKDQVVPLDFNSLGKLDDGLLKSLNKKSSIDFCCETAYSNILMTME